MYTMFIGCKSVEKSKSLSSSISNIKPQQLHLFLDAELARLFNKTDLAYTKYQTFLKSNAKNATAHFNMARLQMQQRDFISAEKHAAKAVEYSPDNKFFKELYVRLLVGNQKIKKAEEVYNNLIAQYPNNEEYLYNFALLYLRNNELDKALQQFKQIEEKTGFNEDIQLYKRSIFIKQGKIESAVQEIEKMKVLDIGNAKYDLQIADIYESTQDTLQRNKIFERIRLQYPGDPLAEVALAKYYQEQGDTVSFFDFMLKVMANKNLDADSKIALLLPTLKNIDTDSSRRQEIIQMAFAIVNESPENKEALSLYADILYFSNQQTEALVQYEKYVQVDPQKLNIWLQLFSIYSEKMMTDSLLQKSKQCIQYFPSNPIPYFYAGVSCLQLQMPNQAIDFLEKGSLLEKKNNLLLSQFYSSLGDAFNTLKEYKKSDSCFDESIRLQPAEPTTLNNYAYYLSLRKERLDDAEKMSKKSLEIQPSSKSFLDTYGWILFQKGLYKEALEYVQKAIDANGQEDSTLFEHLGDIYYMLNHKEKAKELWKKANQKGEKNPVLLKKITDGKL
jgi:tetratricopeptide (TPR) repeat protein